MLKILLNISYVSNGTHLHIALAKDIRYAYGLSRSKFCTNS